MNLDEMLEKYNPPCLVLKDSTPSLHFHFHLLNVILPTLQHQIDDSFSYNSLTYKVNIPPCSSYSLHNPSSTSLPRHPQKLAL